jgi:hypothetical protein
MFEYLTLKTLLEPFGTLQPQRATEWNGADELPAAIADFYAYVGPWGETYHERVGPVGCTLPTGGNPVCIPPLYKLARLQEGFAWSGTAEKRLAGWDASWLVIAEQGGDPFIFEKSSGTVLFAFHGEGSWRPRLFAKDLLTAIGAIAVVATAFNSLNDEDFVDCEPTAEALASIEHQLTDSLGSLEMANTMLAAWEYYR